jgi:hypothetical protein
VAVTVLTDLSTAENARTLTWTIPSLAENDVVVVMEQTWDSSVTMNNPSGTGLAFGSPLVNVSAAARPRTYIWAMKATAGGTSVVVTSSVAAGGNSHHGGVLYVFPAADGYDLDASPNVASKTAVSGTPLSIALTGTADNIGVFAGADWTGTTTSATWLGDGASDGQSLTSGSGSQYYGRQTLTGSSTTLGHSAPNTAGGQAVAAIEVIVGGGGATTHALASTGTGASTGSVNLLLAPGVLSASGSGTSTGSANLNATLTLSASGAGSTTGSAAITIVGGATTHPLSATGTGASTGSLDVTHVRGLSATGTGSTGGSLAVIETLALSSVGTGTSTGSVALSVRAKLSATGTGISSGSAALVILGPASIHQLASTGTGMTSGSLQIEVIEPMFQFSPPTHEEPFRTRIDPLPYFRLTYAKSIVKINGVLTATFTPPPELLVDLTEGVDYFRGGYEYTVSRTVMQELVAAGFADP